MTKPCPASVSRLPPSWGYVVEAEEAAARLPADEAAFPDNSEAIETNRLLPPGLLDDPPGLEAAPSVSYNRSPTCHTTSRYHSSLKNETGVQGRAIFDVVQRVPSPCKARCHR